MTIILILYNSLSIALIISLCVITTYSDLKHGKVFNKQIVKFLICGLLLNIIFFYYVFINKQLESIMIIRYIINLAICCGISYSMYANKTWGAGDAKLFIVIVNLMPYSFFDRESLNFFPGFMLLVIIFSESFIYLVVETITFLVIDIRKGMGFESVAFWKKINIHLLFKLLNCYLFSFFLCTVVSELLNYYEPEIFLSNRGLSMVLNVSLISLSLTYLKDKLIAIITVLSVIAHFIIKYYIFGVFQPLLTVNVSVVAALLIIMFIKYLGSIYNYKEIPTEEVKAGVIVSFDTIIMFSKSRIKGLPQFTSEDTDTRITDGEVNSILLWGKSKSENKTIRIVRHIPFAPFISFGTILFMILNLVKL